jgi:hypothetical protein
MRWWMQFDPPYIMSVDNSSVKGMDFSTLLTPNPDLWMVQWTDGKGELERQTASGENLNGLREIFIDILPYCPLFQQFLTLMQAKALLLPQAKRVQVDLIVEVFNSKRQLPFHYPVAAGDYWWDASDETLFASTASGLQNAIAAINAIVARLNTVVPALNANDASIVVQGNTIVNEINSDIVTPSNNALNTITTMFGNDDLNVDQFNGLVAYINNTMLGVLMGDGTLNPNNINNRLVPYGGAPMIGLNPGIAHSGHNSNHVGSNPYRVAAINGAFGVTAVPWTALPNVTTNNVQWIPVGASAPVTVTPAEQTAIMNGIAARTNDLNAKKNLKVSQVNVLTTIPAVIAYNVTTGW